MIPKHLHIGTILSFSLSTGLLIGQDSFDSSEIVDLDLMEIKSEYQFNDLEVELSRSDLNENLLGIYGSNQLQDLSGLAPNLFTSHSDTRGFGDVISMRGSANSLFFSPPSVALYVDDVPQGSVASYPGELLNIGYVSILSGPQSTSFGRNATAGIINIHTRVPGDEQRGALQLEYGSFDSRIARVLFDGPMSNGAAYSASLGYSARDGYIDNIVSGKSEDDRESFQGRVNFYMNPSEDTQIRFGVFAESVNDGATRLSSLWSPDPFEVSSNVEGVTKLDRRQLNFQMKKLMETGLLIATTSYQDWDLDPSLTDLDLSALDFGFSKVIQDEELWTQEIRFESEPVANGVVWTTGLFFLDSTTNGDATREFPVPPGDFVPPGFVQTERTQFETEHTNIAGYLNGDMPITETVVFNMGARIDSNDSSIYRIKEASNNFGFPSPPEPMVNEDQSETEWSATAGFTVEVNENVDLIARGSISTKPEGYSGYTANPNFLSFDSEHMTSLEAGINFESSDGLVSGSLVAFANDTDDYQFERTVPFSTDFVVVNADEVSATGLEGKLVFNPVEGLFFDFQGGFSNAEFDKHFDSLGMDVSGNHVPFIPEYTVRSGIRYESGSGFFGSTSYTAFGKTYYNEQNDVTFAQSAFGVWDLQLGYRKNNFTISVFGRNLTDESFYQFINPEIQAGSPGAPERFGLRIDFIY